MWVITLSFPEFIAFLAATLLIVENKIYSASFIGGSIILINRLIYMIKKGIEALKNIKKQNHTISRIAFIEDKSIAAFPI